ncbi:hypothetical protein [Kitasatospora sp. MBT66]|uniref:hypothetical protein n=1 Tax=Kitasatospora sp. MBT66 TaxID=1444769 RepID=UPI0005BCF7E8|nr:hypothetical protein [Kitasatospora sp. MBT66]
MDQSTDQPLDLGPADQPLEALVDRAVWVIVDQAGRPEAAWALIERLRERDSLWEAALVLLGPLSSHTVPGRSEREYVENLRLVGKHGRHPVTKLTSAVSARHRELGGSADQEEWRQADDLTRSRCVLQLLASYCGLIGADNGVLPATGIVTLIKGTQIRPRPGM